MWAGLQARSCVSWGDQPAGYRWHCSDRKHLFVKTRQGKTRWAADLQSDKRACWKFSDRSASWLRARFQPGVCALGPGPSQTSRRAPGRWWVLSLSPSSPVHTLRLALREKRWMEEIVVNCMPLTEHFLLQYKAPSPRQQQSERNSLTFQDKLFIGRMNYFLAWGLRPATRSDSCRLIL